MTDIVKGMARAWWQSHDMKEGEGPLDFVIDEAEVAAMRAALLWLADNVSDEMLAAHAAADKGVTTANFRAGFAAAIRAAAGTQTLVFDVSKKES
jgi:hypothetical protein